MSTSAESDPYAQLRSDLRRLLPGMPEEDMERFVAALSKPGPYAPGLDAARRDGVPPGQLLERRFISPSIYRGVERDVRVYVPAALQPGSRLGLMVFQDGSRYLGPEARAATVLDNLIAAGDMPATVALFVEPGESGPGLPIFGGSGNRSIEYDTLGDAYARFLIDELIPEMTRGLSIAGAPAHRVLLGLSSGGLCAFNAAWERPDYFGKVVSHCGSFVDIRGGHQLAAAVRRTPRKALRVYLQTGEHDLDILFGSWTLANRELASALAYRDYDYRLEVGEGGHSLAHGGAVLGDTLRWLWRDWKAGWGAA
jgi:enterochelin esterase-like enzyme